MKTFFALVLVVSGSLFFSGCASALYGHGAYGKADHTAIRKVPVARTPGYLVASHNKIYEAADPEKDWLKGIIFELTPLGIFSPIFGYPFLSETITGSLKFDFPVKVAHMSIMDGHTISSAQDFSASLIDFNMHLENHKAQKHIRLQFNDKLEDDLKQSGKAIKISPNEISVAVDCDETSCTTVVSPPVITSGGIVNISTTEVINQARVDELAYEQKIAAIAQARIAAETAQQQRDWLAKENKFRQMGIDTDCKHGLAESLVLYNQSIHINQNYYKSMQSAFSTLSGNCLYAIRAMTPMQKLAGGYLLVINPDIYPWDNNNVGAVAFLYTDYIWDERQSLWQYQQPVYYVGEYKYYSINGFERSIPAFKVLSGGEFLMK